MPLTALITGGGTGIGAATARRLAKDGAHVWVAGRRVDKLEEVVSAIGPSAHPLVMDVTDADSVREGLAQMGVCDVLVNNAGGAFGAEPVESADPEDWQRMLDVNVLGTLRVTQAALPMLRQSARATIVNVGSTAGEITYEGGAGYCAAKHGVHALTGTLRLELAGTNIRVVEIMPGMVRTDEFALTRMRGDEQAAAKVYEGVDRPLVADDVADCIAFCVNAPQHMNIDRMVIRPVAQAAQHKVVREPIDWHEQ